MRAAQLRWSTKAWRYLPLVLTVTAAVAVLPVVLVWELRSAGEIGAWWLALLLTGALSVTIASGLRLFWVRHRRPFDLLFGELLLWGWLSHLRTQRQLVSAARLLGVFQPTPPGGDTFAPPRSPFPRELTPGQRTSLLRQLADALDAQDMYLDGHSRRVARHATMIGRRMGLSREEVARLRAAAAIHDVGKLHIPPEILAKPAALTDEECAIVRRHPEDGAAMVASVGDPDLVAIVRHHHERVDGHGYPAGLAGFDIPIGARIVAVADTFDAITSPRPYRPAAGHGEAIEELRRCVGKQLDPDAVKAFLSCYSGWRQVLLWTALMTLPQRTLGRASARDGATAASPANNLVASAVATAVIGTALTAGGPASPLAHSLDARNEPAPRAVAVNGPTTPVLTSRRAYSHGPAPVSRHTAAGRPRPVHNATTADPRRATRRVDDPRNAPARSHPHRPTITHRHTSGAQSGARPTSSPASSEGAGSVATSNGATSSGPPAKTHSHNNKWVPPGQSGVGPPGLAAAGPPGITGATPGQAGSGPPGLRGETSPGHGNG